MRYVLLTCIAFVLSSCGSAYHSPSIQAGNTDGTNVVVVAITAQSAEQANGSSYQPRSLPAIFSRTAAGGSAVRGAGALPQPAFQAQNRPSVPQPRIPPAIVQKPYTIGISDVLLLATPHAGDTVAELSGLLAAQNRRQGYMVQDDGTIAIPDIGRIELAGLTLEEAEAVIFQRLVEGQISPTFSLEIAEFNSQRVTIGGAVRAPTVTPIALTPLYLNEALAAAGGVTVADQDYASIRIYREGKLYQIPLRTLYSDEKLQRIQLQGGDSVFVDTEYELEHAQAYFEEQIKLAEFRQRSRQNALLELNTEVSLRRAALDEARSNFDQRVALGAVARDYVYLTGEIDTQGRYTLPFGQKASLADAMFDMAGGIPTKTADVSQIYVLRATGKADQSVTAWHLDIRNAANLLLATRFEMRPNDIIFIAEQPVTRWSRVIGQITPSLITTSVAAAVN